MLLRNGFDYATSTLESLWYPIAVDNLDKNFIKAGCGGCAIDEQSASLGVIPAASFAAIDGRRMRLTDASDSVAESTGNT